jgi:hypothetical protein
MRALRKVMGKRNIFYKAIAKNRLKLAQAFAAGLGLWQFKYNV